MSMERSSTDHIPYNTHHYTSAGSTHQQWTVLRTNPPKPLSDRGRRLKFPPNSLHPHLYHFDDLTFVEEYE